MEKDKTILRKKEQAKKMLEAKTKLKDNSKPVKKW
jgi:hypothetical protein